MIDQLTTESARRWVESFSEEFAARCAELTELDRRAGDGDFGTNLLPAFERAAAAYADASPTTLGEVFDGAAKALMRVGGTSGPLLGSWFRELARAGKDADAIDLAAFADAAVSAVAAVQRLGNAKVGDSTMVDAMVPASEALVASAQAQLSLADGLAAAATAARRGADSTAAMVARRGRASYVGDVSLGVLDPGAVTIALFFEVGSAI